MDATMTMLKAFKEYVDEWKAWEEAYYRIPEWRFFKQMKNIRYRSRLTNEYAKRYLNDL